MWLRRHVSENVGQIEQLGWQADHNPLTFRDWFDIPDHHRNILVHIPQTDHGDGEAVVLLRV